MNICKPFELTLEQQVLWVRAEGVWNHRTAREYVLAFRKIVQPLLARPWAAVLDIRRWQLCPADVFTVLKDNTQWCFEHNLRHVETISAHSAVIMWQFVKATETPSQPANLISQLAVDDRQARNSLQAAGFLT